MDGNMDDADEHGYLDIDIYTYLVYNYLFQM